MENTTADTVWMTIEKYALRMDVCDATVRRWINRGLPHLQVESTIRIDRDAADKWLRTFRSDRARTKRVNPASAIGQFGGSK
jgi:excisionase family DNA binding protein